MNNPRLERLCDCGKVFKHLPSTTKKHVKRKKCYTWQPKVKGGQAEPAPKPRQPFGCQTMEVTDDRLRARLVRKETKQPALVNA